MASRWGSKSARVRFYLLCTLAVMVPSTMYVYRLNTHQISSNTKRCISELASVRYQLDEVTDYKSHVEKMLGDCQKSQHSEKDKFKYVADVCDTMKQQSLLCQSQFDDLQSECKKVRETYNRDKNVTTKNKEQLEEEVSAKKILQQTVHELYTEIDNLRTSNTALQKSLSTKYKEEDVGMQDASEKFARGPVNDKSFSRMTPVSEGVYVVGNASDEPPLEHVDQMHVGSSEKPQAVAADEASEKRSRVPPGFAPVLQVPDGNNDAILQKPPDFQNIAPEKANAPKPNGEQAQGPDRGPAAEEVMPDLVDSVLLEDHEVIGREVPPPGGFLPGHHGFEEDDDEGEEYVA